jgi:hypothetical protein
MTGASYRRAAFEERGADLYSTPPLPSKHCSAPSSYPTAYGNRQQGAAQSSTCCALTATT